MGDFKLPPYLFGELSYNFIFIVEKDEWKNLNEFNARVFYVR